MSNKGIIRDDADILLHISQRCVFLQKWCISRGWKFPCSFQISPYWSRVKSGINMEIFNPYISYPVESTWPHIADVPDANPRYGNFRVNSRFHRTSVGWNLGLTGKFPNPATHNWRVWITHVHQCAPDLLILFQLAAWLVTIGPVLCWPLSDKRIHGPSTSGIIMRAPGLIPAEPPA